MKSRFVAVVFKQRGVHRLRAGGVDPVHQGINEQLLELKQRRRVCWDWKRILRNPASSVAHFIHDSPTNFISKMQATKSTGEPVMYGNSCVGQAASFIEYVIAWSAVENAKT